MKAIFFVFLCISVWFSTSVSAGDEYYEKDTTSKNMEDREVIYYDFDLELTLDNGVVEAEWDEFTGEGFDWYKLVYSQTNSEPVYPYDKTVFVGDEGQTEASFKLKKGYETHYVRICAITLNDDYSKDRYCGEVQKLEWDGEYENKEYKEDKMYKEDKYYDKENKNYKEDKKQVVTKKDESTFGLSETLRKKINELLEQFIQNLEDKDYSDQQISDSIDSVVDRLETLSKQSKYTTIANYMIQELRAMQENYSDPLSDFEDIFEGF